MIKVSQKDNSEWFKAFRPEVGPHSDRTIKLALKVTDQTAELSSEELNELAF
jgi:hypothetical protein